MNKTEKNKKAVISIARKAITYFSKGNMPAANVLCSWKDTNGTCEANGGCPFLEHKKKK